MVTVQGSDIMFQCMTYPRYPFFKAIYESAKITNMPPTDPEPQSADFKAHTDTKELENALRNLDQTMLPGESLLHHGYHTHSSFVSITLA